MGYNVGSGDKAPAAIDANRVWDPPALDDFYNFFKKKVMHF